MRLISTFGLMLALGHAAFAEPGVALEDVQLRGGPGFQHPVLTEIPWGAEIDMDDCDTGWCRVQWQDFEGFVLIENDNIVTEELDCLLHADPEIECF